MTLISHYASINYNLKYVKVYHAEQDVKKKTFKPYDRPMVDKLILNECSKSTSNVQVLKLQML